MSPVTLWNYAGRCGYAPPPFVTVPIENDARREHDRIEMPSYLDADNRPHVHSARRRSDRQPEPAAADGRGDALWRDHAHARRHWATPMSARRCSSRSMPSASPRSSSIAVPTCPVPLKSLSAMRNILAASSFDASMHRRGGVAAVARRSPSRAEAGRAAARVLRVIDMSLRAITDETARRRFMTIPTSLRLPPDDHRRAARVGGHPAARVAGLPATDGEGRFAHDRRRNLDTLTQV